MLPLVPWVGVPVTPPPEPDALSRQLVWVPAEPPDRSMVPAMATAPVARRSSTPVPPEVTVTVTPAGMVTVVKLCTPGDSTVSVPGAKAPSAPVDGNCVQTVPWQVVPDGHTAPQPPPQVVRVSTSHPSAGSRLQSAKLGRQATSEHVPAAHAPTALAYAHACPQAPQLLASVRVLAQ